MAESRTEKVAVIIPAFNEEQRIAKVLRSVCTAKLPTEIIVVSDGSVDRTAEMARRVKDVRVIELKTNVGKGGAMMAGAKVTDAKVLAFVDADLDGFLAAHLDRLILPVMLNECDMAVGVFRGGKKWSDAAQRISPALSGQRAIRRDLFESVPGMANLRMGAEVAMNAVARRRKSRVMRVVLRGVSNCHKEIKMGIMKGTAARFKMWSEITQAMVKTRPRRRPRSKIRSRLP